MKPTYNNLVQLCTYLCIVIMAFSSCELEQQQQIIDDSNIRVIELDREPRDVPAFELNANREELLDYDCDLNWILFDYNSYELTNNAKLELEKVAMIITQNSNFKARIRAFTDSKGRPEYNQKLSRKRAERAKDYLMYNGIPENNISIDAYSEAKPIAVNTEDDSGRKFNRRIELFVLDKLNNTVCRSHPPKIPEALKVESQ